LIRPVARPDQRYQHDDAIAKAPPMSKAPRSA
jgi:hypothetical protein